MATNAFGINIKINEVEIITLETLCNASTIVSGLKKIISKERNISNWQTIDLKCNGSMMDNNQPLSAYDVICDKHLIFLQISDIEPVEIQIEGETSPIIESKQAANSNSTNQYIDNNKTKQNNDLKVNRITLIGVSIFFLCSMISHAIGLFAYCTLKNTLHDSDGGDINLAIGGLSLNLAICVLFLCWFYCLQCDEKGDMEQGELLCGGLWFVALIMGTIFSSIFLFGDQLKEQLNIDNNSFEKTWNQLKPLCYFSYSWILFQWTAVVLLFLYFFVECICEFKN